MSFVELRCRQETLLDRVVRKDRRRFRKVHTKKKLRQILRLWTMNSTGKLPFRADHVLIDTDELSPARAADRIVKELRISSKRRVR